MAKAYSLDLRERAVGRVMAGESRHQVAKLFKISVASVVKWCQRFRTTGSAAAKPMGRRQTRQLAGERDWILARLAATPDLTLRAVVVELRGRGVAASYGSVWRIVHDAQLSFKKNPIRHRTRSSRRRAKARSMEGLPRPA